MKEGKVGERIKDEGCEEGTNERVVGWKEDVKKGSHELKSCRINIFVRCSFHFKSKYMSS